MIALVEYVLPIGKQGDASILAVYEDKINAMPADAYVRRIDRFAAGISGHMSHIRGNRITLIKYYCKRHLLWRGAEEDIHRGVYLQGRVAT